MIITEEQIRSIANIILKKFDARKIYLFGSYADGTPSPNSDLDLCIIGDLNGKRKIDLIRGIRREVWAFLQIPFDIILYEENEFNKRANFKSTLEYKISKDGFLING